MHTRFDPKGPGGPTEADSLGRPTVSGNPNMSGGRYPVVLWRDGLASAPASVPPSRDEQVGPTIAGTVIRPLKRLGEHRGSLTETMRLDWADVFKTVPMPYVSMRHPAVL